ncbi:MAG: hypothetical protein K9M45_04920 [Kiritimatiellales bacterium]|nr:hypothetical protein [Kiritimatiellales bacterium]
MKIYRGGTKWLVLFLTCLSINAFSTDFKAYRKLALRKRDQAKLKISNLPQDESLAVLHNFLEAPEKNLRMMAAQIAKNEYETALIGDIEKAREKEETEGIAKAMDSALERLRAYQKIELPAKELAALRSSDKSAPEEAKNNGSADNGVGPASVTLNVRNWRGDGVGRAKVFAYSRKYGIRVPARADAFAQTNQQGLTGLPLTLGTWTIVAFSQPAYQNNHKGRAVFLIKEVTVDKPKMRISIRPDSEIKLSFKDGLDAEEIHAIDPAMAHSVKFPSLGGSAKGRFTLETGKDVKIALLGADTEPGKTWTFFTKEVRAPASWTIEPQGTLVTFNGPKLLPRIKSANVSVSQYAHSATPLSFTVQPGERMLLPPGTTEIDYAVDADLGRLVYGPMPYELKDKAKLSLALDSPTEAEVNHDFFRDYAGRKKVLAACVTARDANGHLLTGLQGANKRAMAFTYRTFRGNRLMAESENEKRSLSCIVGEGFDQGIMPELSYEITADLGPGVPKKMKASEYAKVDTEHFTLYGPSLATARLEALGKSTEKVRDVIQALRESPPGWEHKDVLIKVTLPPTVGASAGGRGINARLAGLVKQRWLGFDSMGAFPHEMLHLFKFGHDDYMGVWQVATQNLMARDYGSDAVYFPNMKEQQAINAFLRGENGEHGNAVPWLIYARYGLAPFRFYQNVEKRWKPALQTLEINDDETCCAIFSEATGEDVKPLYELTGSSIRNDVLDQAKAIIAGLDGGTAPAILATDNKKPQSPEAKQLNKALGIANRMPPGKALANLSRVQPLVDKIPVNRDRVRFEMRFALAYDAIKAEKEMFESLRRAQRAAITVNQAYFEKVRNLSVNVITGQPAVLGHL